MGAYFHFASHNILIINVRGVGNAENRKFFANTQHKSNVDGNIIICRNN